MNDTKPDEAIEGIAIIGLSGRFPRAKNVEEFWRNLRAGVEAVSFFSDEELAAADVKPSLLSNPNYVRAKAIIDDIELFDASFFGLNSREAELTDPQHRLFLECAWEALENAGYDSRRYKGAVSVYAGQSLNSYLLSNLLSNRELIELLGFLQTSIRNRNDHLSTQIAYRLDLKGPAITVQTACSTSLVAVHLACQSLLNGECDMALAGGVAISVPQKTGYLYQEGGIFSPDGHCRAFDAGAQGTISGNGAGLVVLKRLKDAVADGDCIHAVIRGSAVNNDGAVKVGYTAPSVEGQAKVIAEAQAMAGVDPDTITYIEAHGTGTAMGDPIEVEALTQVFRTTTNRKNFCALGSVKTNIGHLDAAAGVAGLIKAVLALKHKMLPPSLNFEKPNLNIDFAGNPFYVSSTLSEWKAGETPRRAGVSSFGIGGTNAHVIVEEAPAVEASGESRPLQLLLLSAKTSTALEAATANLLDHLQENSEINIADVAYTLQSGRSEFNYRRAVVCRGMTDAIEALDTLNPRQVHTGFREPKQRPVVFMFPGQGSQYVNMGRELYVNEPVFREQVDLCSELLHPHLGFDLRTVLYPADDQAQDAAQPLTQTNITQPALFVIEYAMARLWMQWGVRPQAMIGHSIGEYVAACLAGVFTLEEALALVATRGRLIQVLPGGSMMVVPLPEQEVLPLLNERLSLAAVNGPALCVVSGTTEAVDELEQRLVKDSVACRRLHTSHAFHSRMMEPALEAFALEVSKVTLRAPQIPYISNVSGTWITEAEVTDPAYWARHLRQPVRFSEGVHELLKEPDWILLEVGPGRTLGTLARWNPFRAAGQAVLNSLRHPDDPQPDEAFLLATLGKLWMAGIEVDWPGFHAHERRLRVPLPAYPFERQRYWVEPQKQSYGATEARASLTKKPDIADWFYAPSWKRTQSFAAFEPAIETEPNSWWLIFLDECGLGTKLARRLEQLNQNVVAVTAGDECARISEHVFMIDPRQRDSYETLLTELRSAGRTIRTIIHMWNVTESDATQSAGSSFGQQLDFSFYSLLYLAQALGAAAVTEPLQIAIVSNGLQELTGEEALQPEKATLMGLSKVIPQEYTNISCRNIDIVLPPSDESQKNLIEYLIAETAAKSPDAVVAYRGTHRWTQIFEPLRLDDVAGRAPRLRQEGVYLITGGLGGIGLVLATHLAETVRAKLVLIGRSSFPERSDWEQWIETHDAQDEISQKIVRLQSLEAMGAEVLVFSADVSDEPRLREVVKATVERFGAINGVIHSAGVPGGGVIQLKTPEMAESVLAPKVKGTLALAAALKSSALDFFVVCSSRSSILGGFGQSDYCAANAFLDAFAHYDTSRNGAFTVSVNWDAWQEVGMLADKAAMHGLDRPQRESEYKPTGHPLLDKLISEDSNGRVYLTEFTPLSHWVLDEHRIVGNAVIPGTAYLEMARAVAEKYSNQSDIEIRDAFFLAPLGLRDDERKAVRTVVERNGDGYEFHIFSNRGSEDEGSQNWQEYATGKLAQVEPEPPKVHDLKSIIEQCNVRQVVITDETKKDEDLGPRWQSLKRLYIGNNELLAFLELPRQFHGELETLKLHPALLDRSTGTGKEYLVADGVYLPMGYRRLRIRKPLTGKIYIHVRYRANENDKRQTISFDMTLMDERGEELVEIESFTQKRVNDIAGQIKALARRKYRRGDIKPDAASKARTRPALVANVYQRGLSDAITPKEGAEAFKRILAANVPPQVIVSTKDLQASIEQVSATRANIIEQISKVETSPGEPAPGLRTVLAGNELEQKLAEIWQEMLGVEGVGVHDNFFELGGDSVQAIQIIARINELGLQLTPQQLFQNQTIAELAAVAQMAQAVHAEQGPVTGPVPLTPVQRRFFEESHPEPHHFNQAILLEVHKDLKPPLLEAVVRELLSHHDALRLRFEKTGDDWNQNNADLQDAVPFRGVDLSGFDDAGQIRMIEESAAALQTSLSLEEGPVIRVALFDLGPQRPGRLLIVLHHLVADGVSLRILLEDLQTACDQLSEGRAIQLPAKTTSYQYWARGLAERAQSPELQRELDYWLSESRAGVASLPAGNPGGVNTVESEDIASVRLSAEETGWLMQDVPQVYHTQINEVLLTALALAFAEWSGADALLVDLENHGREEIFSNVSLSRTVGAFTTLTPLLLEPGAGDRPGDALKAIKEQVRAVRAGGIDYGLLRYMNGDQQRADRLRSMPQPEVRFNYLGQLDQVLSQASALRPAKEDAGPVRSPHGSRSHLIEMNGLISGGLLQLDLRYSRNIHDRETMENLAARLIEQLRALILHCKSPEAGGYTPSDFPLADLNADKLNTLSLILAESDETGLSDNTAAGLERAGDSGISMDARGVETARIEEVLRQHPAVHDAAVMIRSGSPSEDGLLAYVQLNGNGKPAAEQMQFSLFYFADDDSEANADKYRLCVEGAKFADQHGFNAVWTPERHFHPKAGLYPNPVVLSAALAMVTERVQLRAGSVALPLHNSIRVAEEWAVVDNLSKGRVGVSFTSGWVPNDFAFFPERYADKRNEMFRLMDEVQRLWRGQKLPARDGVGNEVQLKTYPRPIQPELPIWLTCSGSPDMFAKAGELGVNVLTALLAQTVDEVEGKISLYREALAKNGHHPDAGCVTMMVHTFIGNNQEAVLEKVRGPLTTYLRSHVDLIESFARSLSIQVGMDKSQWVDSLVAFAFERYYRTASLIGTPETCKAMVDRLRAVGVNEVACLIDFGVDVDSVLDSLQYIAGLKDLCNQAPEMIEAAPEAVVRTLGEFAGERLPSSMIPHTFVFVDALPLGPDGKVNYQALPAPPITRSHSA